MAPQGSGCEMLCITYQETNRRLMEAKKNKSVGVKFTGRRFVLYLYTALTVHVVAHCRELFLFATYLIYGLLEVFAVYGFPVVSDGEHACLGAYGAYMGTAQAVRS